MGRPDSGYLSFGDDLQDLATLDKKFCENAPRRKHPLFAKVGPDKARAYWGEPDPETGWIIRLGARGKIWALSLLLVRYGHQSPTPAKLAETVIDDARKSPLLSKVQQILVTEYSKRPVDKIPALTDTKNHLADLISEFQKEGCPPVNAAAPLLQIMIDACVRQFFASDPGSEDTALAVKFIAEALEPAARISAYYKMLRARVLASSIVRAEAAASRTLEQLRPRLGVDEDAEHDESLKRIKWRADLFEIDPVLANGVVLTAPGGKRHHIPGAEDLRDPLVVELLVRLGMRPGLLVLHGNPLAGKKARMRSLLRAIISQNGAPAYELVSVEDGRQWMPILALSASGVHYRDLVDKVISFLERYHAQAIEAGLISAPTQEDVLNPAGPFEEAFEHIFKRYADLPALYIITDVEAFESDRMRHAIRDTGIRRLLQALGKADRRNRVIITTTDAPISSGGNRLPGAAFSFYPIPVDPPRLGELKGLLEGPSFNAIPIDLNNLGDKPVLGNDLVLLAALLKLAYEPTRFGVALSPAQLQEVRGFLDNPRDDPDSALPAFHLALVDQLRSRGLLRAMALVAVSEDGVREAGMRSLLDRWRAECDSPDNGSDATANDDLRRLAAVVGDKVLRSSTISRFDPDEYDLSEDASASDKVWEMDAHVASTLLQTLRQGEPELVRQAHRLIARIARQRAQNKKVLMRSPLGSRATEDASRDIQSFVNLLASIALEPGAVPEKEGPPLRLTEPQLYSLTPSVFNPARALRFAAYCLLREDIDHDYRLTMVFDEDALRLDLYCLLFRDVGTRYSPRSRRAELPSELPLHMRNGTFTPDEVIGLLSTVCLSAFHSQRFGILDKAAALAQQLADREPIRDPETKLGRIWCTQVDSYILRGEVPDEGDGLQDVLAYVRQLRRYHFSAPDLHSLSPDIAPERLKVLRSAMRLLAREAEITGLIDTDRGRADALYGELESLEARLAEGQHDPVVLSGRAARRYIKYLLLDPSIEQPSADPERRAQILNKALALLHVNASRLRRFSGGDRVGVMVDHARLDMANGRLEGALSYARAAQLRAFSGNVSHGGKLDVLAVLCEAYLRCIEEALSGGGELLHRFGFYADAAATAAHDLRVIAESIEALPTRALASYLQARTLLAAYRLRQAKVLLSGAHVPDPLERARREIDLARDLLAPIHDHSLDQRLAALESEIDATRGRG